MGISASKRVAGALRRSPDFAAACDSAYDYSLALAQNAFPGLRPYQLPSATALVHANTRLPLLRRWVPSPPTQAQVNRAAAAAVREGAELLSRAEFMDFAVELFRGVIVSNARHRVLRRVSVGVAGIAGLGALTRSGKGVVGSVAGVYALCAAAAVYLSLGSDLEHN